MSLLAHRFKRKKGRSQPAPGLHGQAPLALPALAADGVGAGLGLEAALEQAALLQAAALGGLDLQATCQAGTAAPPAESSSQAAAPTQGQPAGGVLELPPASQPAGAAGFGPPLFDVQAAAAGLPLLAGPAAFSLALPSFGLLPAGWAAAGAPPVLRRKRGRPRKVPLPDFGALFAIPAASTAPKRRGRPPEAATVVAGTAAVAAAAAASANGAAVAEEAGAPGAALATAADGALIPLVAAPPCSLLEQDPSLQAAPKRKRGRPPKSATASGIGASVQAAAGADGEPRRKRGRPRKEPAQPAAPPAARADGCGVAPCAPPGIHQEPGALLLAPYLMQLDSLGCLQPELPAAALGALQPLEWLAGPSSPQQDAPRGASASPASPRAADGGGSDGSDSRTVTVDSSMEEGDAGQDGEEELSSRLAAPSPGCEPPPSTPGAAEGEPGSGGSGSSGATCNGSTGAVAAAAAEMAAPALGPPASPAPEAGCSSISPPSAAAAAAGCSPCIDPCFALVPAPAAGCPTPSGSDGVQQVGSALSGPLGSHARAAPALCGSPLPPHPTGLALGVPDCAPLAFPGQPSMPCGPPAWLPASGAAPAWRQPGAAAACGPTLGVPALAGDPVFVAAQGSAFVLPRHACGLKQPAPLLHAAGPAPAPARACLALLDSEGAQAPTPTAELEPFAPMEALHCCDDAAVQASALCLPSSMAGAGLCIAPATRAASKGQSRPAPPPASACSDTLPLLPPCPPRLLPCLRTGWMRCCCRWGLMTTPLRRFLQWTTGDGGGVKRRHQRVAVAPPHRGQRIPAHP